MLSLRPLAAVVCVLASSAFGQDVVEGELGRRIDEAVERATLGQFWGSVLVAKDGKVILAKGYGIADEALRLVTADSLFDIGSVTKCFTAAAVLRLEMDGKLKTIDTIDRHLKDVPEDKRGITIHQLLTHTSGIGGGGEGEPPRDDREAFVSWILADPLQARPGTAHRYSNAGYFLLAAIIERASGEKYEDYVTSRVLRPAGMAGSTCMGGPAADAARLTARQADWRVDGDAASWPYPLTWGYRGAGGVVSSARDLFAWDRTLRSDAVLSAEARKKYFEPALSGYAYGWQIAKTSRGRVASHSGGVRGYTSWLERWLDEDLVIAVLTNGVHNPVMIGGLVKNEIYPPPVQRVELTARLGSFTYPSEWQAELTAKGGVAVARSGEGEGATIEARVMDGERPEPALVLSLSPGSAEELVSQLESAVGQVRAIGADAAAMGVRAEVYPKPYQAPDGVLRREDPRLGVSARAGLMHPEEGGDQKVLVFLTDPAKSFMPVFLKLEAGAAAKLAADLAASLPKKP